MALSLFFSSLGKIILGNLTSTPTTVGSSWTNTGTKITLETGRWLVQFNSALITDTDLSSYTGTTSGVVEVSASLAEEGGTSPTSYIESDTKDFEYSKENRD